ncbi:TrmH family RNA methyltransferase [Jiangella alkaliphila]|uniref:RNA methyltransferase, TrmH family n=1 Tax=Jiangella alkaliphila TaxID=419479 RepID=A0A1H2KD05_9ACTN|nr:RNA methyltransferase [Jiangella alkaliphila]SDU66318.1 RNA methyltransferase, TrmH family [Jiangella alkaliphila]
MLTERSGRVREAHKLLRRAAREKAGLFLAEGPQAVREAVAAGPGRVVELFATTTAAARWAPIVAAAEGAGVPVHAADDAALAALSETVTPQGLVAVCRSLTVDLTDALAGEPRLVAVLAEARDPGNAGTVVRCADAAGADAVVLTHGSADPQGGKAVRASAGSVFHLPVVSGVPAANAVAALRERGLTVLAADGAGSLDLDQAEDDGLLAGPVAWLFGNEAWGLPAEVGALADHVVRVPIYGRAESLNLATAAAVCLYGSARARRRATR